MDPVLADVAQCLDKLPDLQPTEFLDIRSAYFEEQVRGTFELQRADVLEGEDPEFRGLFYSDDEGDDDCEYSNFVTVLESTRTAESALVHGQPVGVKTSRSQQKDLANQRSLGNYCVVKNFSEETPLEEMRNMLQFYGRIIHCNFVQSRKTGEFFCYGDFKRESEAKEASELLDGLNFNGQVLSASFIQKCYRMSDQRKFADLSRYVDTLLKTNAFLVKITGLPNDCTTQDLFEMSSVFGSTVEQAVFSDDELSEENRCVGIAVFWKLRDARDFALAVNCSTVVDNYIDVSKLSAEFINVCLEDSERTIQVIVPDIVNDEEFCRLFECCGEIHHIVVKHNMTTSADGSPTTYGYVRFAKSESATGAVSQFNGFSLRGRRIAVSISKDNENWLSCVEKKFVKREQRINDRERRIPSELSLFVSNLPPLVTKYEVRALCSKFGTVCDVRFCSKVLGFRTQQPSTTKSFVRFRELTEVYSAAKALNGFAMPGKTHRSENSEFILKAAPSKETEELRKAKGLDVADLLWKAEEDERRAEKKQRRLPLNEEGLMWQLCEDFKLYSNICGTSSLEDYIPRIRKQGAKTYDAGSARCLQSSGVNVNRNALQRVLRSLEPVSASDPYFDKEAVDCILKHVENTKD